MIEQRIARAVDQAIASCDRDTTYTQLIARITASVMVEVKPLTDELPVVPDEDLTIYPNLEGT